MRKRKMMKKILTLKIEVDMENPEANRWKRPEHYYESEVEEVVEKLRRVGFREFSKYSSENGKTNAGNSFKLVLKTSK